MIMMAITIMSALVLITGMLIAGYLRVKDPSLDIEEFIFGTVLLSIAWPILLAAAIIVLPFYGLFLLGKKLAERSGK